MDDHSLASEAARTQLIIRVKSAGLCGGSNLASSVDISGEGELASEAESPVTVTKKSAAMEHAVNEMLTCPVCTVKYMTTRGVPRVLSCHHTFCHSCLMEWAAAQAQVDAEPSNVPRSMTCPTCRRATALPEGGLDNLQVDFRVVSLLESIAVKDGEPVSCEECSEDVAATSRCDDCCEFLCDVHTNAHALAKRTAHHRSIPLQDYRKQVPRAVQRLVMCSTHPRYELTAYCPDCAVVTCLQCAVFARCGHKYVSVEDAAATARKRLEEVAQPANAKMETIEERSVLVKQTQAELHENAAQVQKTLQETEDKLLLAVRSRISKLRAECRDIENGKSKNLRLQHDSLTSAVSVLRSTRDFARDTAAYPDPLSVVKNAVQVERDARSQVDQQVDLKLVEDSAVVFVPNSVDSVVSLIARSGSVLPAASAVPSEPGYDQLLTCIQDKDSSLATIQAQLERTNTQLKQATDRATAVQAEMQAERSRVAEAQRAASAENKRLSEELAAERKKLAEAQRAASAENKRLSEELAAERKKLAEIQRADAAENKRLSEELAAERRRVAPQQRAQPVALAEGKQDLPTMERKPVAEAQRAQAWFSNEEFVAAQRAFGAADPRQSVEPTPPFGRRRN
eukprot:TRINITY_DN2580_c0_g1_i4.p1 TRINITY_DN2580_c0_g1~~TRINITY_DN2580_c0_g1_i4.p1  ORF type:complete len:700 (-),score=152.08 TRINITY_DN2580_c0_g1_i4:1445-3322(-)